jgi:hypothetical protein
MVLSFKTAGCWQLAYMVNSFEIRKGLRLAFSHHSINTRVYKGLGCRISCFLRKGTHPRDISNGANLWVVCFVIRHVSYSKHITSIPNLLCTAL